MHWRDRLTRFRRDRDIDEELASHVAMAVQDGIERGMTPEDARAAALWELGNLPLIAQATREVWPWTRVEQCWQDVRFGARILWQAPGFSATCALLVALVVGGNTTIYSIVNGMLISPARGVAAERLVAIKHVEPGAAIADPFVSFPNFLDYGRSATTLSALTGWSGERLTVATDVGHYAVFGGLVASNYFDTLGVALSRGRPLRGGDDDGVDGVAAVISHRLWTERFGLADDVIGRSVEVNNIFATIVGVATPGFAGALVTPGEDIWLPIRAYYAATANLAMLENRAQPMVAMIGARAPGVSLAAVRAEFDTLVSQLHAAHPGSFTTYSPRGIVAMAQPRTTVSAYSAAALLPMADMAPTFLALFSVVTALTLLVVSANVANLMLGRAVDRQRDSALRQSLGASRLRILRMLFAEGAAVSLLAWGAACVFAYWMSRILLRLVEPQPGLLADVRPDWTLAAYAMALAAFATLAFTLAPALRAWKQPVLPMLKAGDPSVAPGQSRLVSGLVVLQVAFSVVLLTGAGLNYRSLSMLESGHVGYDPQNILLITLRVGRGDAFAAAPGPAQRAAELAALERVRERLEEEPDVLAVSYSPRPPGPVLLATTPVGGAAETPTAQAFVRAVGPHYLRSLGLTALDGRDLSSADTPGTAPVVVINEHLALELFPGRSPLGATLHVDGRPQPFEIVGVAPNALFDGPIRDARPKYALIAQQQAGDGILIDRTLIVRHQGALDTLTGRVGRAIAEVDADMPVVSMSTMTARLADVTGIQTQVTLLVVVFALVALLIAALGQYATAMFSIRRRTRELGIRAALGATPSSLRGGILRDALTLTVPGLLIGTGISVAVAVASRSVLFGVSPVDPATFGGVIVLVLLSCALASYLPATRASGIDVVKALRAE